MALPRALQLRRHFQRVVLTRPWLTFVVMGLAFFCFGMVSLNLLHLLRANADFLLDNGFMGFVDGGGRQLFELVVNGFDDIALTLRHADKIRAFEAERLAKMPWLANRLVG